MPASDTAIDPAQPSRLEKKTNMVSSDCTKVATADAVWGSCYLIGCAVNISPR